ncbi:phosphatidylinositol 4-phosphate 5-kinase 10-like [Gossypium australe]|uniref:1-phosphatidylinositol-4-phosphate 5-kinase n=1 Tax=Gossypium australe TaxID=47621 RepID=A0A5B6VKN7_9ROSI|nr:phosphatidylinositol 4-phosphate 5-kinase 10-like [Gossypium australe]
MAESEEISASDLTDSQRYWIQYSRQQCLNLPSGSVTGFEWKDYCPKVFRLIQELENISNEYYMMLICSDETLRKVSSSVRAGNMFLLSKDNRFVIRTLRKSEVRVLLEMLPDYYNHLRRFRNTVLNKLYGAHVVKPVGGAKVYFVVVANIFKSDLLMHRCYDLKGSLQGRKVEKMRFREKILHKESDLDFLFYLEPLVRHRLLKQIKYDCAFLEAAGVMDYSLMLGLHVKGSPQGLLDAGRSRSAGSQGSVDSSSSTDSRRMSCDSLSRSELYSHRSSASSFRDSIDMGSELSFGDQWLPNSSNNSSFGEEMSARGVHVPKNGTANISSEESPKSRECYDVLLYFGIVDFFQNYSVIKRIEHAYKSLQFDRKMIAAVNPKAYSSRFQEFISDIFKADDTPSLPTELTNDKKGHATKE